MNPALPKQIIEAILTINHALPKKKVEEGLHNLKGIINICLPKQKKDRSDYLVLHIVALDYNF